MELNGFCIFWMLLVITAGSRNGMNSTAQEGPRSTATKRPSLRAITSLPSFSSSSYSVSMASTSAPCTRTQGKVFKLYLDNMSGRDEHDTVEFKCSLRNTNRRCENTVQVGKLVLNESQLEVNGTVNGNVSSKIVGDTKVFRLKLHYESHHNTWVRCVALTLDRVSHYSNYRHLLHVHEHHPLTLTSSKSEIFAGQNFTLNCTAQNHRGAEVMEMYVWRRGRVLLQCGENKTCTQHVTTHPTHSTITTYRTGGSESSSKLEFECSTAEYSLHSNQDSPKVVVMIVQRDRRWVTIVSVSVPALMCAAILIVISINWRKMKRQSVVEMSAIRAELNNLEVETLMYSNAYEEQITRLQSVGEFAGNTILAKISAKHSKWVIPVASVSVQEQIGAGNFGCVYSGTVVSNLALVQKVAIKTIKKQILNNEVLSDFEKEIDMLSSLQHDYVLKFLGICTEAPLLCIITELMEHGQLDTYLSKLAPTKEIPRGSVPVATLKWMCQQPLIALEFLSARSLVHRDVSARNCLVGSNNLVKLADFGLSRDTSDNEKNYYKKSGGVVPVKWTAPEALTYGKYTTYNDVWAFGVLCWEVFSFGAQPYAHLSNRDVMSRINQGERLERPQLCPEPLWALIKQCWTDSPYDRIKFPDLLASFVQLTVTVENVER